METVKTAHTENTRGTWLCVDMLFLVMAASSVLYTSLAFLLASWASQSETAFTSSSTLQLALVGLCSIMMLAGLFGLGDWKKWGLVTLSIGALLFVAFCGLTGLFLDGVAITTLYLLLLITLRGKWSLLS